VLLADLAQRVARLDRVVLAGRPAAVDAHHVVDLGDAATLPADRTIFSRVAWSGATPNTFTVDDAPSNVTVRPVALRFCALMYATIASPAASFAALVFAASPGPVDRRLRACRARTASRRVLHEIDQSHRLLLVFSRAPGASRRAVAYTPVRDGFRDACAAP
jgi:hypothetical protein